MDLWGSLIKSKYLSKRPLDIWLRRAIFKAETASLLWRGLLSTMCSILPELCWIVGSGVMIYIGRDPISGLPNSTLSPPLLVKLHEKQLYLLTRIFVPCINLSPHWWSTTELGLTGALAIEWNCYIRGPYESGISLNNTPYHIIWKADWQTSIMKAHLAYIVSIRSLVVLDIRCWHKALW